MQQNAVLFLRAKDLNPGWGEFHAVYSWVVISMNPLRSEWIVKLRHVFVNKGLSSLLHQISMLDCWWWS